MDSDWLQHKWRPCRQGKTVCGDLDGSVFMIGILNTIALLWWLVNAGNWSYDERFLGDEP